jgi:branched-chain amino acid transport system substrate-binding protein
VLNADDRTVSRIDPGARRVVRTLAIGEVPTELVAGSGAVWVGSAARRGTTRSASAWTHAFTRLDAESGRIVARVELPRPAAPDPRPGHVPGSVLAVSGFGALWAVAPDYSVVRIDYRANRIVARIPVRATAIATAPDGIWALEPDRLRLVRIDPRRNAVAERIKVPFAGNAIAAGAGAVWMTEPYGAVVLRVSGDAVQPITVGVGASAVAASTDAVWVANVLADTVTRIDPQSGSVRQVVPAAFPQNVAVGAGAVWVTTRPPGLRACGPLVFRGPGRPDRVIVSELPLQAQGDEGAGIRRAADAVAFVLARHGYRAGRFSVGYRSCDYSTAAAASWDIGRCLGNAKGFAAAREVIGVVGPSNSECAGIEIGLTNRSATGPVPIVSGWNTYRGLTRGGPEFDQAQYPSGVRHYFRVVAQDQAQSAAGALLAKRLGARRVAVLHSLDNIGQDLAGGFPPAARRLGLAVVGPVRYTPDSDLRALARRLRREHVDAVYVGARFNERGGVLVRELRRVLGRRVELIVTDIFLGVPDLLREAGSAARGVYYTAAGLPDERLPATGRRFLAAFDAGRGPEPDIWPPASHGAAATEVLLAAIAASDGTRESVVAELHRLRLPEGVLGEASFDARGDANEQVFGVWRVAGPDVARTARAPVLRGAVLDRVLRISGA